VSHISETGTLDELLIERIMRPVPRDAHIVPVSFPITSFGDPSSARVATLSINPSVIEYTKLFRGHAILPVGAKRLIDRETLNLGQLEIPSLEQSRAILDGNHAYFRNNPYFQWFKWLQDWVLSPIGASFHDGSAVHLDLVQWATDPVWSKIPDKDVRSKLIADDLPFLKQLLELTNFDALYLNGRTVYETIKKTSLFDVQTEEKVLIGGRPVTFWTGYAANTPFLCWSKFISDYGTTTVQREATSERVRAFTNEIAR
jgi:hypothetical protein